MILLNAVRALIILLGLLLLHTFQIAYNLNDLGLLLAGAPILVAVLCAIEVSDAKLISIFNPEETKQ